MDIPLPVSPQQISSLACYSRFNSITSTPTPLSSSAANTTTPQFTGTPLGSMNPIISPFAANVSLPTESFLHDMFARITHSRLANTNNNDIQSPINLSTNGFPYPPSNDSSQTNTFDPTSLYLAAFAQLIVRQMVAQAQQPVNCTLSSSFHERSSTHNSSIAFLPNSTRGLHNRMILQPPVSSPWLTTSEFLRPSSSSPLDMTSIPNTTTNRNDSPSPCALTGVTACDSNGGLREKRYQCNYPGCSKAYYKRSHLNEHSHLHTGLKPHLCAQPDCGARFTRADQLSRHRRAHTGERNFYCSVCQKRFKRSDHLKVHVARNVCTKSIS